MIRRWVALLLAGGAAVGLAVGGATALAEIGAGLAWGLGVGVAALGVGAGLLLALLGVATVVDRQLARRIELMQWQHEWWLAAQRAPPAVWYTWEPRQGALADGTTRYEE